MRTTEADGVVKSLIYCVVAVFQELDILYMYSLVPKKSPRLVYEPFYLAIQQLIQRFLR